MHRLWQWLPLYLILCASALAQNPVTIEGTRPTYCAASLTTGAGGTGDVFYLQGSASKTIRVISTEVSGIATAATVVDATWLRRVTSYTGGTTSAASISKSDTSADPTAAGAAFIVTGTVTPGTAGGNIRAFKLLLGTTTSAPLPVSHNYGVNNGRALVLRGAAEFMSFNMTVPAGLSLNVSICWVEE